jgi:hypothetical protein
LRRRFGGWGGRSGSAGNGGNVLPGLPDHGDQAGDRYGGSFGYDVLEQHAIRSGHQLHDRLVGLDLGQHVALGHLLALFFLPLDQPTLFHGRGERLHHDFRGHLAVHS